MMNKSKISAAVFEEPARSSTSTNALQSFVAGLPADSPMRRYQVAVSCQGCRVAEYIVIAANALSAINLVENHYSSEPVSVERTCIEDAIGRPHKTVLVRNWHGYSFDARELGPC